MIESSITIVNKLGLHARAAAKLVAVTSKYGCRIEIGHPEQLVDAKSIMAVMLLAAAQGTQLALRVDGEAEAEAHSEIVQLIGDRFQEDE